MSLALTITTDGRDEYLERTIASIGEHLTGDITHRVIWDDSGDHDLRSVLAERYMSAGWSIGWPADHRVGHMHTRAALWRFLAQLPVTHIAGWEDDFELERDVDLDDLVAILDIHPHLAQVALLRDNCYPRERKNPDNEILGWNRKRFRPRRGWFQHRIFFTCNPSVYPVAIAKRGWPEVEGSEKVFGDQLVASGLSMAFYGGMDDPPAITHIGARRNGGRY